MPLLEALEARCRVRRKAAIDHLRRCAPTWLMQMTSALAAEEREKLGDEVLGATSGECSGKRRIDQSLALKIP